MGTASPAGWSKARLSLFGVFLLWVSGLWKARLPPRVTAPLAPPPSPDWGSTSYPTPYLWGDFQGLLCGFLHFSLHLTCVLDWGGGGCLSFFLFLVFLSPSSVCFQRCCWADGQGRGLSAHQAQGSEKGKPRASGDQLQYCISWLVARGCVQ